MSKLLFKSMSLLASVAGIGGISQSVAGHVVAKCADPTLTDSEFNELVEEVAKEGYELKYIS